MSIECAKISVSKLDAGERLDKFLCRQIKDLSRSQIQKLIKQGQILVNNRQAAVHCFLKADDIITVAASKDAGQTKNPVLPAGASIKKISPKIIFADDDFLIINKPVGMLVHPTEKNESNTLVDWLSEKFPQAKFIGEDKFRSGIVHRLDRDVSGVMIAAKTNPAFDYFKEQFKKRKVTKEYFALVYGHLADHEGKIDLPIGRSREGKFVAHPKIGGKKFQTDDRRAKTLYWVEKRFKNFTLLRIRIITGRTHQIRAHFSAIGHPIVGDLLYRPRKNSLKLFSRKIKVINPGRIMLHSKTISFKNPAGQPVEFDTPLPPEMESFINQL